MNTTNFHGLMPILREGEDGEGGGGTGSTAVATVAETALSTATEGADETALETTNEDGTQRDVDSARTSQKHPGMEVLRSSTDPEVKKFYSTVVRDRAFRKEMGVMFPGVNPKAAVQSLMNDMIGLAGRHFNTPDPRDAARRTGLQQVRDRLAEIEEIDLMFYGGNPQLLDGMTGDEEGRAAFAKLAPHMDNKWKEIAPNAWTAKAARQILADMKGAELTDDKGNVVAQADVPYRVQRLSLALQGDKDGNVTPLDMQLARSELTYIAAYIQRITSLTKISPEVFTAAKDATDSKLAERERKLAEREASTRDKEWRKDQQEMTGQIASKVYVQMTKGHTIPPSELENMQSLYALRFDKRVQIKEPKADEIRKGFLDDGDRDGYLAYEQYLFNTYGVPVLKKEITDMLTRISPAKPGARPAAAAATPANGQTAAPKPPAAGFFKLMEKPPQHVIDHQRRTPEMVKAKQAILRIQHAGKPAGSKVTW